MINGLMEIILPSIPTATFFLFDAARLDLQGVDTHHVTLTPMRKSTHLSTFLVVTCFTIGLDSSRIVRAEVNSRWAITSSGVKLLMIRLDSLDSSRMVTCKVKSPERKSTRGVSNSRVVRLLTIRLDSNDSRES